MRQLTFPPGSLVALIHREGAAIVPSGSTVLQEGDRLTIIGNRAGIQHLREELGATAPVDHAAGPALPRE